MIIRKKNIWVIRKREFMTAYDTNLLRPKYTLINIAKTYNYIWFFLPKGIFCYKTSKDGYHIRPLLVVVVVVVVVVLNNLYKNYITNSSE